MIYALQAWCTHWYTLRDIISVKTYSECNTLGRKHSLGIHILQDQAEECVIQRSYKVVQM